MESFFQCRTIQTKELLREVANRLMRVRLIIYAGAVCGLSLVFLIFVLARQKGDYLFFALVLFFSCLGLSVYSFESVSRKYAEETYKENLSHYQETTTTVVKVYETALVCENLQTRVTHRYTYDELKKMRESKNLFLLQTNQRSTVVIDKKTVSGGSVEELRRYLQERLEVYQLPKTTSWRLHKNGRSI